MKRIKLEDLEKQGDIGIRLSTIFDEVAKTYDAKMCAWNKTPLITPKDAANQLKDPTIIDFPEAYRKKLEQFCDGAIRSLMGFPETEAELFNMWANGRQAHEEGIACPTTKRYIVAKSAVNEVLQKRGLEIQVY